MNIPTLDGRRYQVFVSSTFRDLVDERQQLIQALLTIGCFPIAMEYFPASYERQWEYIQPLIKSSDFFICLVGGKYGSCCPLTGISYTQREYEHAISCGVPIAAFFHEAPHELPAGMTEETDTGKQKLARFIELVKLRLCKGWKTKDQLQGLVIPAIIDLLRTSKRPGWIRGDEKTKEFYELQEDYSKLREEFSELESLSAIGPVRVYQNYDRSLPDIQKALDSCAEDCERDGDTLKIRIMGICLHKSLPPLIDFIRDTQRKIRIEIRLAILDQDSDVYRTLDTRWEGLYTTFNEDLRELVTEIKDGRIKKNICIKLVKYSHMPNWHGVLINYQHLFMGHCLWHDDGRFTAGQNSYEYFIHSRGDEHLRKIKHYVKWFDYCREQDQRPKSEILLTDTSAEYKASSPRSAHSQRKHIARPIQNKSSKRQ